MKKFNFCAGPAILPSSVLAQAAQAVTNYNNIGLSLLEISHRSQHFTDINLEAQALVKELLNLPDNYAVLFLTGGASMQFAQVPFNLLPAGSTAAYLNTGRWANNAIKEARLFGKVAVVGSSAENNYTYIPKNYQLDKSYAYWHITTNNTVVGTQMHQIPNSPCPIVADMSSDIFSKPLKDIEQYGLIYAGMQKNTGPAGATLVIVNKDLLGKAERKIPSMIDYRTHVKKLSVFNTPPVFSIYVSMLNLRWIKEQGLQKIATNNEAKARLLYNEIDRNPLFEGITTKEDRSTMNATFAMHNSNLEDRFLQFAEENGCFFLKGHRSVGGLRASMYNALPIGHLQVLVEVMQAFEQRFG